MTALVSTSGFEFTHFHVTFLLVGSFILLLGGFVLLRNVRRMANLGFFLFTACVAVWLIGEGLAMAATTPQQAFFLYKIVWIGVILAAPSLYMLTIDLLDFPHRVERTLVAYVLFLPFLFAIPFNLITSYVELRPWGYGDRGGMLELPYLVVFFGIIALIHLYHRRYLHHRHIEPLKRKQVQLLYSGLIIATFAVVDFLPTFGVPIPPVGFVPLAIWCSIIAYAIVRYQLFQITAELIAPVIIESLPDSLLVVQADGKIAMLNSAAEKHLGYSKTELIGTSFSQIFSQSAQILMDHRTQVADISKEYPKVFLMSKNGEQLPVSLSSRAIFDTSGSFIGVTIIAHNLLKIQQQLEVIKLQKQQLAAQAAIFKDKIKEAEKQNLTLEQVKQATLNVLEDLQLTRIKVEQEKAKDDAILESIGDGMVVTDSSGKIFLVNSRAQKILECSEEELLGKYWGKDMPKITDEKGNAIPPDHWALTQSLKAEKTVSTNFYLTTKTGKVFPSNVTAAPVLANGKKQGAVVVFRDITKEREVDRAKTEFVSLASHQLRTPLTAISWYTEMLLAGDAGKISGEQKKYLGEVYAGNKRMIDLVNALLNMSRIDLGTFTIEPEKMELPVMAKSVISELRPTIEEKQLTITERYSTKVPPVNVDRNLMRIVLQNILSNAVKYTPDKGHVSIAMELKKTKNTTKEPEDQILITVTDDGYGIPMAQQDRIFEKLFRADNAKQKVADGNGLGLYIVKSILDHAGGKIWFVSKEGTGTTFYVTLPVSGMKKKVGTKQLT